jgi:hypothetical protein
MLILQRFLVVGCLLSMELGLGCSSKAQPMKNGERVSGGSETAKPVPINPLDSRSTKVLPPEPDSPPAPPVKK